MQSVDLIARQVTDASDIAFQAELYEAIFGKLTGLGLNLAFFAFTKGPNSSCARMLDGKAVPCPTLTLYLKNEADFQETGIDPHFGNWDDKWGQTRSIRETLNAVLQRYSLGNDYVCDQTFIFVRTLEELVFHQLGEECADDVRRLIIAEAPGVIVQGVYWNGAEYYVLMKDKADYRRVKRKVKINVTKALPQYLANADKEKCCQNYKTSIAFGYDGVPLHFLGK